MPLISVLLRVKLRGHFALLCIVLALTGSDIVQRLAIAPIVRLFPSRRIPVLTRWQKLMAAFVLRPLARIGGAKIGELPAIPGGPGVLVLMNHQSLLDIPLVVSVLDGSYPQIVTRRRYGRGIPLISHMTRLYQYPLIDPTLGAERLRSSLAELRRTAAVTDVPIVIFPEGTRTRDGEIGPFKKSGLRHILEARGWTVYLVVADGFWEHPRFADFLRGTGRMDGRVEVMGPYDWNEPGSDPSAFVDAMRDRMVDRLAEMRAGRAA